MSQKITPGTALTPEDVASSGTVASPDTAEYALRLGDDSLVLAQRLGWWVARAPELEEDIALANIALDLLGHARSFLSYAGSASGRSEDDLAYFRDEPDWRSAHLFEIPNGDFAHTIVRQLLVSHFQFQLYSRLVNSTDTMLAAISAKAVKEVDYHLDHSTNWMLRLALGTEESRRRTEVALSDVWPYLEELLRDDELVERLAGIAVLPSVLGEPVMARLTAVLERCELEVPSGFVVAGGGRNGVHSEHLGVLLAEMQVLARAHPGVEW